MAYATFFKTYNAVNDGVYLENWQAVLERLENPVTLNIDINDFNVLKKTDAKNALMKKFANGGYDAGECPMVHNPKTGLTKPSRAQGVPRPTEYNMVVLDADDELPLDFDDKLKNALGDYEYYVHATISSMVNKIRRRVLIPMATPVSLDVREAIIRCVAEKVGMECIDRASIRNKQLMCFPVHCKNGDNYHYHNTGELLDYKKWLPNGWQDMEKLPHWKDEKEVSKHGKRERKYYVETGTWIPVADKNRLHNAFNKTYRISDILIESGKYTQTDKCRWSHTYDDCKNGIKVTNDSVLFSYYGNDILSVGCDLDAYETALILRYGDIKDKANWQQMAKEVAKDENVKNTLLSEFELPADAETWALLYDNTEEGIAQRCAVYYPHKMYNGNWYRYKNGIYKIAKDHEMLPDCLQMCRIAYALQPDDDKIAEMVGKANTARNILKIWAGIAPTVESEEWENKPWLLHFNDCVVDLMAFCDGRPCELPHDPNMLLMESTGHNWEDIKNVDPKALDEVVKNMELYLPNEELRNYFQRAMGRCLTTDAAAEDKCMWLMGPEGGNGKSTILGAVKNALGSYYYDMQGKYLYYSSRDRDAEAPSPELAGMRNKRFVNFCEYNSIRTLDPEKYKNYTSAGFIKARRLNSNSDEFRAKCICVVDCNGMPGLQRKENAILRRTRVVPFNAKLDGDQTIKNRWCHDKKIGYAMMFWLLLGLKSWYSNGCKLDTGLKETPHDVYVETMAWINSFDDPDEFFEDYYQITGNEKDYIIADEAWEVYVSQIYDKGASRHMFRQAEERWLRSHGITRKAKRVVNNDYVRRMCYVGVKLINENNHATSGKFNHIEEVTVN